MKLITWNTCGIRENADFYKRPMILQTLIRLQASVAFLQETHIGVKNTSHIKKIPGWKSFYSVHHPRSKGVAILIKNDFHFEHIKHDIDPTGSYIVLISKLNDKCFTLVNVYNHAKEHKVLQRLSEYLCQTAKGVLIVAGDFNTVLNTDLDQEYPTGHTEPLRPYLEEFISSLMDPPLNNPPPPFF
uniref:exodeoxyribonuclease III n=1 Tax=Cyprinus carpio TaxID=7962 RepID=A0A8C1S4K5_CYPCA